MTRNQKVSHDGFRHQLLALEGTFSINMGKKQYMTVQCVVVVVVVG